MYAQLAHGFSWALIFWAAWNSNLEGAFYGFAWIHTVALAWVTMAALAILLFALPNFIDAPWRGEPIARWAMAFYGAGVALLLYAFLHDPAVLVYGATVVLLALLVYLATAFATLGGAMQGERVKRAVARAFGGTFVFLLATAVIGFGLAWMLSARTAPGAVTLAAAHADLGTLGWLALLIFGVSMRTIRPIAGEATRLRWMHIAVGSLSLIGVPLLAAGVASQVAWLAWIGGALFALAALGYSFDVLDITRRARNPYRAPQAFIVVGVVWLLVALAIGAGVLGGKPWQQPYGFILLMGFIGQFANAHFYHIAAPVEHLEARLSWYSFFAVQIAIAVIAIALMNDNGGLAARGAIFGLIGWLAMMANILAARLRAKVPPKTIVLR